MRVGAGRGIDAVIHAACSAAQLESATASSGSGAVAIVCVAGVVHGVLGGDDEARRAPDGRG